MLEKDPPGRLRPVREWARGILEDPQVRERTLAQARLGRLAPAVLIELMNRAYGKVKDAVDMDQRGTFQFIQVIKHPKEGE